LKIAITGQDGFIGYHLYNSLAFIHQSYKVLDFKNEFFQNSNELDKIVSDADIIVHLAGVNRDESEKKLLEKNLFLTKELISSIERTNFKGKLIFTSSIQYKDDNAYGISKRISSDFFLSASIKNNFIFVNLIIPNVFGPFSKPNYNSFIATFCSNSVNKIPNTVNNNKKIPLIYIDNLVNLIIEKFKINSNSEFFVKEDTTTGVRDVKELIDYFREIYLINGNIPDINTNFKINLFNTFQSYIDTEQLVKRYNLISDERGSFVEIMRSYSKGQTSYSYTNPKYIRGNHFHTRKIERFSVIEGEALINVRKIGDDKTYSFNLTGKKPSYIDMKVWHTHNIQNIGDSNLITAFWINELYNEDDSDTFFEKV
jgi:UDP-2-acetamido-2,6-beta-L-arabino-hexul-4-ose reductase